jgi:hypothetical protein
MEGSGDIILCTAAKRIDCLKLLFHLDFLALKQNRGRSILLHYINNSYNFSVFDPTSS